MGAGIGTLGLCIIGVIHELMDESERQAEPVHTLFEVATLMGWSTVVLGGLLTAISYVRTRKKVAEVWRIRDEAIERELRQPPPESPEESTED